MKILVIEDDIKFADVLVSMLEEKYETSACHTLSSAYRYLEIGIYDLLIVDRILVDKDAIELIRYSQLNFPQTKILCTSKLSALEERICGLKSGADDYLPKPFASVEFMLKVDKLLRIQKIEPNEKIRIGQIDFTPNEGCLDDGKNHMYLRKQEKNIFSCLVRYKNQVVSREKLIREIWHDRNAPQEGTLDVYIRRLRIKLQCYSLKIKTVRGFGYSLQTKLEQ